MKKFIFLFSCFLILLFLDRLSSVSALIDALGGWFEFSYQGSTFTAILKTDWKHPSHPTGPEYQPGDVVDLYYTVYRCREYDANNPNSQPPCDGDSPDYFWSSPNNYLATYTLPGNWINWADQIPNSYGGCGRYQFDSTGYNHRTGRTPQGVLAGTTAPGPDRTSCPEDPTPTPTPTPTSNAPECDKSQLIMSVSPNPATVASNVTFSLSGTQGSTWIEDSWNGGVDCSGEFWGDKTCKGTAVGSFTWTHKWKNCAPNDCTITSAQCSKTKKFTVNPACPLPGIPTLLSPADNTVSTNTTPILDWTDVTIPSGCDSITYETQVKKKSASGPNVISKSNLTTSTCQAGSSCPFINGGIVPGFTYFWRIRASTSTGGGDWTNPWKYTVPSPTPTPTPTGIPPTGDNWWQVLDGDITAREGEIISKVPDGKHLIDKLISKSLTIARGSITTDPGTLSSSNWRATGSVITEPNITYQTLKEKILASVLPTHINELGGNQINTDSLLSGFADGEYYYSHVSDPTSTIDQPINVDGKKIVLFVDGNLTIKNKITLDDNSGFFMVLAGGNISIDPELGDGSYGNTAHLEGIYFANNDIDFTGEDSNRFIRIEGSVIGLHSIKNIQHRKKTDDQDHPSVQFVFRPDQVVLMPNSLSNSRLLWQETAP